MVNLAQLGIAVDPSGAQRGLKEVRKGFDQTSDRARKTGGQMRSTMQDVQRSINMVKGAVVGLVAALSIRAAFQSLNEWADAADKTAKVATRLGVAVEKLSELQIAAELSGVSADTFNMALQRMTRRLAEAAQGTGEAKDAIIELGLDAQKLSQMAPDAAFREIAGALGNVKDQSDKVRLAFKLFDSEGVALLQMLKNGKAGLDEMTEAARATGGVLTDEGAKAAEQYKDALLLLTKTWEGFQQKVITPILPVLTQWLRDITGYFQQILVFAQIDPWEAIKISVMDLTAELLDLVAAFAKLLPFGDLLALVAGYGADRLRTEAETLRGQLQTEHNMRRTAEEMDRQRRDQAVGTVGGSGTIDDPYRTIGPSDAERSRGSSAQSTPQAMAPSTGPATVNVLAVTDDQGNVKRFKNAGEVGDWARNKLEPGLRYLKAANRI